MLDLQKQLGRCGWTQVSETPYLLDLVNGSMLLAKGLLFRAQEIPHVRLDWRLCLEPHLSTSEGCHQCQELGRREGSQQFLVFGLGKWAGKAGGKISAYCFSLCAASSQGTM